MSSQQQLGLVAPPLGLGEVDHVRSLSDNLNALLLSDNYQDITLIVENHRIPAHKIILASRSEYFRYTTYVFRHFKECFVMHCVWSGENICYSPLFWFTHTIFHEVRNLTQNKLSNQIISVLMLTYLHVCTWLIMFSTSCFSELLYLCLNFIRP